MIRKVTFLGSLFCLSYQLYSVLCNSSLKCFWQLYFFWEVVNEVSPFFAFWSFTRCYSVQFSRSIMSSSLQPHELQHVRPPCPSPTPGVHPNPCPLSQWCHPTISSFVIPFSSCPKSFQHQSALRNRWPKYWSFSFNISPSNENPGLMSFRMDWLDHLAVQGTLKSLLQHHSSKHQFFRAQLSLESNNDIWVSIKCNMY